MEKTESRGGYLRLYCSPGIGTCVHELRVLALIVRMTLRSPFRSAKRSNSTAARLLRGTVSYVVGGGLYDLNRAIAFYNS